MKNLAGWGAAVIAALVLQVHAAEIAFTGGEGGTGTDLSVAANWDGGELPADGPVRTPVLTGLDERVIADGATFAVVGTDNLNVEVTLKDGVLSVVRHRGYILFVK